MTDCRIILGSDANFTLAKEALLHLWKNRDKGELHEIIFRPYDPKRNLDQNAFLWSAINTPFGRELGYSPEEMHEVLLAEIYGTKIIEFRGKKREVPNKRTHDMKKKEFSEHIDHCIRIAAEMGIVLDG